MTQGSALNFACISLKFSPSQRAGMGSPAAGPGTHCRRGSQGGHRCVEAKRSAAAGPHRSPQGQRGSGASLCHNTLCRSRGPLRTARAESPHSRLHCPAPKRAPCHLESMCCRVSQEKAAPQSHNTAPLPQSTGMPWDSTSTTSARQPQAAAGRVTAASASTGAIPELLQKSEMVKCLIKYVPPIARALQQP